MDFPPSVRLTLEGWTGTFVGKKRREVQTICKVRNKIAIENEELSMQNLKNYFVYFLWPESKACKKDGPLTLVGFIDWLSTQVILGAAVQFCFWWQLGF